MTREAIEYFKFNRKIFCEDHLKICPKDSIAYQASLKEKEFYDMAIKALEQEPTDKKFTKADIDAIDKAINEGWELRVNEILSKIRAEIVELWQNEPCAIEGGCLDEILEVIDKYKAESEIE